MSAPPAGWEAVDSAVPGVSVWRPIPDDPRTREAPEGGYRCPRCGATVSWDVAHGALACVHCGFTAAPEAETVGRQARADAFTATALQAASATWELDRRELHCDGCGADLALEDGALSAACPFCGSARVLVRQGTARGLRPSAVIPFAVGAEALRDRVRAWLGRGWMHPSDLSRGAVLERFVGVYLPYWTFDALARSTWRAEVGRKVTRRVRRGGEWKTETHIEWRWRDGALDVPLPDRLQPGTSRVHAGLLRQAGRYDLSALRDYHPDFLAGWQAQAYDVGLEDAWEAARGAMREDVQAAVRRDIGSPHVRNLSVAADFDEERWRYVLLPAHLCAYTWQGRTFRIVVNGQDGRIAGQKPVVWPRVWAVVAGLFAPGVLLGLVGVPLLLIGVGALVLVVAVVLVILAAVGAVWIVQQAHRAEDPT